MHPGRGLNPWAKMISSFDGRMRIKRKDTNDSSYFAGVPGRKEMIEGNRNTKSPFSKLHHIAIVVRNMEKAIRFYTSIGVGPFEDYPTLKEYIKLDVPDEVGFHKVKIKVVQIGPLQIQLIQPGEGKSLYKDFLEKKGEGVYHLGFVVDDVDDSEAELRKLGLKVLSSGRREEGSGFSYLDTAGKGGVTLLIRQSPGGKQKEIAVTEKENER
jgi:methylmalonyl-CoA/ethylmalonyl-CoA epimerase